MSERRQRWRGSKQPIFCLYWRRGPSRQHTHQSRRRCRVGHFFFWGNRPFFGGHRPAMLKRPLWSLAADLRMSFMFGMGQLDEQLALAGIGRRGPIPPSAGIQPQRTPASISINSAFMWKITETVEFGSPDAREHAENLWIM